MAESCSLFLQNTSIMRRMFGSYILRDSFLYQKFPHRQKEGWIDNMAYRIVYRYSSGRCFCNNFIDQSFVLAEDIKRQRLWVRVNIGKNLTQVVVSAQEDRINNSSCRYSAASVFSGTKWSAQSRAIFSFTVPPANKYCLSASMMRLSRCTCR